MAQPRIDGYRVLHPIGQGGQAMVYLAERAADGLTLALKVLDRQARQDAVYLERLKREYQVLSAIDNPYVARIYDHSFAGELPYIAMEFVERGSLRRYVGAVTLEAWNGLLEGALAVHDRFSVLEVLSRLDWGDDAFVWRIRRPARGGNTT